MAFLEGNIARLRQGADNIRSMYEMQSDATKNVNTSLRSLQDWATRMTELNKAAEEGRLTRAQESELADLQRNLQQGMLTQEITSREGQAQLDRDLQQYLEGLRNRNAKDIAWINASNREPGEEQTKTEQAVYATQLSLARNAAFRGWLDNDPSTGIIGNVRPLTAQEQSQLVSQARAAIDANNELSALEKTNAKNILDAWIAGMSTGVQQDNSMFQGVRELPIGTPARPTMGNIPSTSSPERPQSTPNPRRR